MLLQVVGTVPILLTGTYLPANQGEIHTRVLYSTLGGYMCMLSTLVSIVGVAVQSSIYTLVYVYVAL